MSGKKKAKKRACEANAERCEAYYEARREDDRAYKKAWRKANPEKRRAADDKRSYGLKATARQEMYARQGGKCAICGERCPFTGREGLHIDHDHRTNLVRGLLCQNCNHGLGKFADNPERLRAAADYLVKFDGKE